MFLLWLTACNRNRGVFGKLNVHFHEEIISWQRKLGSLASATAVTGQALGESFEKPHEIRLYESL